MDEVIHVERFTRKKEHVSGIRMPADFPRISGILASKEGEIRYSLRGALKTDAAGSQKRTIKCIISGWFFLVDPVTLQGIRHDLDIESQLVLVASESAMPSLEAESELEDYVVCGNEMNVVERVEEEILLDLPFAYAVPNDKLSLHPAKSQSRKQQNENSHPSELFDGGLAPKLSPFAKLAELKKK